MGDILSDIIGGAQNLGGQIVSGVNSLGGNVRAGIDNARVQGQSVVDQGQAGFNSWVSQTQAEAQRESRAARKVIGDWGRAAEVAGRTAAQAATNPMMAPAIIGAGIGAGVGYVATRGRASPENDAGVTYVHEDEQSGRPMKTGKYAEQLGEGEAIWVEPMSSRPAYKKVKDIGLDRKTWSLISEGYSPLEAVDMRIQEETNPRTLRELDWQRLQLAQNEIEVSSDYHHWAIGTGKKQSINPFENTGDAALALKLGTRQEGKLQQAKSNPGLEGLFADLPGGMGLEDASWDAAKTGFTKKSPSFTKAIRGLEATRGNPGVYGTLDTDRNYTEWNRVRPNAQVNVISPMEILTGSRQRKAIPAKTSDRGYADITSIDLDYYREQSPQYKTSTSKRNATNELALLRETGIMGDQTRLPRNAVNATRNLTKSKKSKKNNDYFYGI